MGTHIFISYRRSDSQGVTGRIHDRLRSEFENVYVDVDSIGFGEDFFVAIEEALGLSDVLLAVIGMNWLDASDARGRRIDNPDDLVRHEIRTALAKGIRVIPILVNGASMPRSSDLPKDIDSLARRNAFVIRHESFHADTDRLIKAIGSVELKRRKETMAHVADAINETREWGSELLSSDSRYRRIKLHLNSEAHVVELKKVGEIAVKIDDQLKKKIDLSVSMVALGRTTFSFPIEFGNRKYTVNCNMSISRWDATIKGIQLSIANQLIYRDGA